MNWRVSPLEESVCNCSSRWENIYPFHPESAAPVHHIEKVLIFLTSEKVQTSNLEVAPEMTHIILFALHRFGIDPFLLLWLWYFFREEILRRLEFLFFLSILFDKKLPQSFRRDIILTLISRSITEQVWNRFFQLCDDDGEPIGLIHLLHFKKRIAFMVLVLPSRTKMWVILTKWCHKNI